MLELSRILELLGYLDSPNFRTKETQFEPESVHYFRIARERHREKFSVKGLYVFGKSKIPEVAARPAVCVGEAPNLDAAQKLHRRIWNLGNVPFLLVRLPDQIRVYSGFCYEPTSNYGLILQESSSNESKLRSVLHDFSADSIDSARIWQAQKERLDTRNRVDAKLLANLKDLAKALTKHCRPQIDLAIAHALIGKFVYLRYLRDRNILDDQWLEKRKIDLAEVFGPNATVRGLRRIVEELEARFNGDVFHLELGPNRQLNDSHVQLVASIFAGDRLHVDETTFILQLHLQFRAYDFQHIPVETLSSIYEQFLHSQLRGRSEGAYYTPEFLADYLLSEIETVRHLQPGMKILDASAGSGVFLVLAYRRLIELERRRTGSVEPMRLREILLESIYGVERQNDACNVATFSLILTLLNYVTPPALHANEEFKFPVLLNTRIFCDDFFNPQLELPIPKGGFDFLVGNPPWIELKPQSVGESYARQWILKEESIVGNRVADAFAAKGGRLLSADGVAGLLLPATTLFTLEGKKFRQRFFTEFYVVRITNFSNLRGNLFGGRVIQPAATIVFRKRSESGSIEPIVHYAPFAVNQVVGSAEQLWVITIQGSDIQFVSQKAAATGETSVWKLALWGTARDDKALEQLQQIYPLTLEAFCERRGWGKKMPRQGAELRHRDSDEDVVYCEELKGKKRLDTDKFNEILKTGLHFSVPRGVLTPIPDDWCYVRKRGGLSGLKANRPPHLLVSATWKNLLLYKDEYFAIPARQMGIAATQQDRDYLRALAVYLGSSLVDYFVFFNVPEWGVYSTFPHVVLRVVRNIPTPDFTPYQVSILAKTHRELVQQERDFTLQGSDGEAHMQKQLLIDHAVFETLNTSSELRLLIEDFRDNRLLLDKGSSALRKLGKRPSITVLQNYGRVLKKELERFLLDEASVNVDMLTSTHLIRCRVRFETEHRENSRAISIEEAAGPIQINRMLRALREELGERFSQWVYVDRNLRCFDDDTVQIFKTPRLMDWTRTQALNDADEIIAEILDSGSERVA